jgi:hypothetical protein
MQSQATEDSAGRSHEMWRGHASINTNQYQKSVAIQSGKRVIFMTDLSAEKF